MNYTALPGFGEELAKYPFKDTLDWLVHVRDPKNAFQAQPTYIASEYLYYLLGLSTLLHCFIVGGRWKYHWLGIYIYGVITATLSFVSPDINNHWHSQSSVMLLGRRLPLHITLAYPSLMYTAAYMVAHLKLPRFAESLAAGLTGILLGLPCAILGVKFIHWSWHDTDPNTFDRHHHVPWTSHFFHLSYWAAFTFALHFWRRIITGSEDKEKLYSCGKELMCVLLACVTGLIGGILQFAATYHPLHDLFKIPTENCFFLLSGFYLLIVWAADRQPAVGSRKQKGERSHWSVYILSLGLLLHHGFWFGIALLAKPEAEVSIGLHQTTGPCNHYSDLPTILGMTLKRQTYLCTKNYDEAYFNFDCLKKPPKDNVEWYTICGTEFSNRAEYISMIGGICLLAFIVYYNMLFKSAPTIRYSGSGHHKSKDSGKKLKKK